MAVKRATLEIESTGQAAYYVDALTADTYPANAGPVVVVEVDDFAEALELVDTLNRSRAQKKRERKPTEGTTAPEKENGKPAGERLAAVSDKT